MARRATLFGVAMVLIYTALISSADAITKFIAGGYAAPQLYAISGGLVALFCLLAESLSNRSGLVAAVRTTQVPAMAVRSIATVIAATCFFYAFKLLPFAEVFVFVGLMPIFAGLMSGPILREKVSLAVWISLAAGFVGVICLFPGGIHSISAGHLIALSASLSGTTSMVMARYIGRHETNALAQVFWPNVTIMLVMGCALPFVYKPMPLIDVGWAAAYAGFLFLARWVLVVALRQMAAYVVTPLMNLQFVWMVILGALFFGEIPGAHIYLGVTFVMGSGLYLIYEQFARSTIVQQDAVRVMTGSLKASPAPATGTPAE
ncbi:DMT family transporter [Pseudooceanicola sediminis]|uniref:DMT family transporter n=2 Tax=Pseudooceanicola sediminis TaxID=2211117 RepID=A0A399J5N8_9RHOB|nr:DMT family transporter [Puniceibacterium sp. HSS470]RII40725.1 DMT family transporter [Pseudooceanicola sediminis]|tara:strand:- start:199146 stop:200102 length:957 start_codon:yes stop_codon:yes gene_type:complete